MKKIILLMAGFMLSLSTLSAQCTPDTTITEIIQPPAGSTFDTIAGEPIVILPYAQVNQSYSETMHFKIPEDTTYIGISGTVDSVKLLNVLNMPSSFSMNCSPSGCVFLGGTFGCAEMSGTPSTPDSVELQVAIEYTVTVMGNPAPIKDTLGGFYLVVKGQPVNIAENSAEVNRPNLYPNPANDRLFIEPNGLFNGDVELRISNILGSTVFQRNYSTGSKLNVNVSEFKPGVYLYSLRSGEKSFTGKFSIAR